VARRPIPQQKFAGLARQMYDDPDLTGDVLHFALAIAEMLTRSDTDFRGAWTAELSRRVAGRPDWARYAVRQDLPRHVPVGDGFTCVGQMIRRPGLCGRSTTQRHQMVDPLTGERTVVGTCSRHHDEINKLEDQARKAWIAAGKRPGPQNAGGILERYFTADWDRVYTWASPYWTRPDSPAEPPRRPTLTLIVGGLDVDEA